MIVPVGVNGVEEICRRPLTGVLSVGLEPLGRPPAMDLVLLPPGHFIISAENYEATTAVNGTEEVR